MDELPATRNFEKDLSDLTNPAPRSTSRSFRRSAWMSVTTDDGADLIVPEAPVDPHARESTGSLSTPARAESLLLLSELPEPQEDGLYGKACTTNTGAVFREGDVVDLEFKLVEREPKCNNAADELYPWDDCSTYENIDPLPAHDSQPRPPGQDPSRRRREPDEDSGEYAGTSFRSRTP